jgi:ABC-type antimicrobial peptide transport system permease subunit
MISAGFFSTLGVQPILGRAFRADDDQIGTAPVVMIGGGLWKRKFGSSRDIVGQSLTLNGASYIVIGVVIGLAAALGLTQLMANQLFGVTAHDPLTFVIVAILLTLVALLACYIPARRAVQVDPLEPRDASNSCVGRTLLSAAFDVRC